MPVGYVLVGNAGCDVEHNDAALAVNVVAISQAAEFFLASRIPYIELDRSEVL